MSYEDDFTQSNEYSSRRVDNSSDGSRFDLSQDPRTNDFLNDILQRLRNFSEKQTHRLTELTRIGVALSSTRNLDQLLEMIVDRAREFTDADGGTLYLVDEENRQLKFTIVQTESLGFRMGGLTGDPVTIPPIALFEDGAPNFHNVCAYVANTGKSVNIPDVYEVEGFDFSGARDFDKTYHYRSISQLVIPMRDHQGETIGVLALINARDPYTGVIIPFAPEYEMLTEALASEAAVALTNARLIHDLQELFNSFIKTIADAIDAKSTYTGGHIERVANLTMEIANRINAATTGPYAEVKFTDDELYELRLAAWLHDTGKITTPEYVVDKKTKLETIFDRKEVVRLRFELAMQHAAQRLSYLEQQPRESTIQKYEYDRLKAQTEAELEKLMQDMEFVFNCNKAGEFMADEKLDRLKEIASIETRTSCGSVHLIDDNELYNLSIRKGTFTKEEFQVIHDHVVMTYKLLSGLPFPKKLKNVPFIAGAHHEKLNGKGYPNGLTAEQIPLQVRILTLADIFEALTANDRPYISEPKKLSLVLGILDDGVKKGELDPDLVKFFLDAGMHLEYAHKHIQKSQIDIE